MKRIILILMGIIFLGITCPGWAETEERYDLGKIIVTATKTEVRQAEIGSSTTIISEEDIRKTGKETVSEVLRGVSGVTVMQSSPFGGLTDIYLRGSKPGHTLVMIDGVELNDPMVTDRSFDFAHLTTDNLERIEVVRGPQSTLYGSDAIGGIINIITKKGKGKPKLEISSEGGSHNTFQESLGLSGSNQNLDYSFSVSRLDSDGISQARDGTEKDGYENTVISTRLGYKVFDNAVVNLILRYTDAETDLDDYDYITDAYVDDPNYTAWNRSFISRLEFNQAINSWWDHKLSFSYNDARRKYRNENDNVGLPEWVGWYKGDNKKFEWQHNFYLIEWDKITGGFEYEEERGSSYSEFGGWPSKFDRKTVNNKGYYLQNQLKLWDSLFITPGLRIDDHQLFGAETTYKLSSAYFIKLIGTRLKANWGTGFKAPSLYQLYSTEDYGGGPIGDPNLKPDKSKSFDFGFEQNLFDDRITFGLTYFHNDFKNMVDYDMVASKYKNIGRAQTKGFEIESSFKPIEDLKIGINYTYTNTKDKETGKKLVRRPKNQLGLSINWSFLEKGNINLTTNYVGHRWDSAINTNKTKSYTKIDLSTSYCLTNNFQIFARIENLFDKSYEEVRGYATQGRSFYAGVKATF